MVEEVGMNNQQLRKIEVEMAQIRTVYAKSEKEAIKMVEEMVGKELNETFRNNEPLGKDFAFSIIDEDDGQARLPEEDE